MKIGHSQAHSHSHTVIAQGPDLTAHPYPAPFTGEARITGSGSRLPAKMVIHTVGPIYSDPFGSRKKLTSAYSASMKLGWFTNLFRALTHSLSPDTILSSKRAWPADCCLSCRVVWGVWLPAP